ncbi:MAG TPA: (Fe-S)-binding protein, partial [Chloroflexi bacterium]|nr:(Fe-S)-binding protein [Chloroflexota bacterium]
GQLKLKDGGQSLGKTTFHDPCYLGRHNDIVEAPRFVLEKSGAALSEMPHHGKQSFCCGAGGAQMWKEEEEGTARVNITRFKEAQDIGAATMAVGCPFCLTMMTDASKEVGSEMQVLDIAEIVAEALE